MKGNPSPTLIWYISGALEVIIDNTYSINSTGVVRNELSLRKLNRKDYRTKLTCRASSNALYEPIDTSVVIDMNCKFAVKYNYLIFIRKLTESETIECWDIDTE